MALVRLSSLDLTTHLVKRLSTPVPVAIACGSLEVMRANAIVSEGLQDFFGIGCNCSVDLVKDGLKVRGRSPNLCVSSSKVSSSLLCKHACACLK